MVVYIESRIICMVPNTRVINNIIIITTITVIMVLLLFFNISLKLCFGSFKSAHFFPCLAIYQHN